MKTALAYERISKSFFGVPAVREVSFSVASGQVLGLVGENGAGKSTLMNILGGVLRPDGGSLALEGAPFAPASPLDAARAGVAFIHQELNLFPNLSIAENIFLAAFPRVGKTPLLDRSKMRLRTADLLRAVELDVSPDTLVEALPPGERQLVEIAKALSFDARVVIFDEPTTSLTVRETERLFALIERLRGEGRAMIYISHALEDVLRLANEIVVLRDGAVVASGPRADFTTKRLISAMVGRDLAQLFPERTSTPGAEPVLEVEGVSQPGVVEDVRFTVHAGEVLGIAGLMGSGRTELARILFGLDPCARGDVRVKGQSVVGLSPRQRIARGMALLTENRRDEGLLLDASVRDNTALASLGSFSRGGAIEPARLNDATDAAGRAVQVTARPLAPVKTLSGGNQQKVVLAKWLMTEPSLFILDEPTRGIDVGAKLEIYRLIDSLAAKGAGVLIISSELEELLGTCDRILVMKRGEIAGSVSGPAFDREQILRLALGDRSAA